MRAGVLRVEVLSVEDGTPLGERRAEGPTGRAYRDGPEDAVQAPRDRDLVPDGEVEEPAEEWFVRWAQSPSWQSQ